MEARSEIAADEYRLVAAPTRGGSILSFEWRDQPLMRRAAGPGILDVACFPIVPYSNRIAGGRFSWNGRTVTLAPNFPAVDSINPLHGPGWLSAWSLAEATGNALRLFHDYSGPDWPWAYRAELSYSLGECGLTARLAVTNCAEEPMPAGLGFHPYFPRTASTRYLGLHRGEWCRDSSGLPTKLDRRSRAIDWWDGAAVNARAIDTVYSDREGPLQIQWPDRNLAARIDCSNNLSLTSVFAPEGMNWFCVEPVSHMTDALNRAGSEYTMAVLQSGETMVAEMGLRAAALD